MKFYIIIHDAAASVKKFVQKVSDDLLDKFPALPYNMEGEVYPSPVQKDYRG